MPMAPSDDDREDIISMVAETPEESEQFVASMMSRIESAEGILDLEIARETLDFLIAERKRVATSGRPQDAMIFFIFNDAIKKLEAKIETQNPKEAVEAVIDSKVAEAYERIARGELIHAIPLLHTALKNAQFQDFWSESSEMRNAKRVELETLLAATRQKWIEAGRPTK